MHKSAVFMSLACGAVWLLSASTAAAQVRVNNTQPLYTSQTVSPFLNLGVNSEGISNYQTIIRPLVSERDDLRRQSLAIQQLEQRMRGRTAVPESKDAKARSTSGREPTVRFMHYSHYFEGPR